MGRSTTTATIYKLDVSTRTITTSEKEAAEVGKGSFRDAWVLGKLKVKCVISPSTISWWILETSKYYTDVSGHIDFIKKMIPETS